MTAVKTFVHNGKTIEIYQDEDPESPRNWDNLGTMVCFHPRYDLGDKTYLNPKDFGGWDDIEAHLREQGAMVVLPLYLFNHSGLRMTINKRKFAAFDSAGWDWGQVGFIYVTKEQILKEYGKVTEEQVEIVEEVLRGEVETYDQFLQGAVYSYSIRGPNCGECGSEGKVVDSCGGFYGLDEAEKAAREAAD